VRDQVLSERISGFGYGKGGGDIRVKEQDQKRGEIETIAFLKRRD
jgi:hypothetical protein